VTRRASFVFWFVAYTYFIWLAGEGLLQHFAADDMMNLARYQSRGFGGVIADNLLFFRSDAYRPLGGLLYLSLYKLFHLNPLPYRIACFVLLLVNLPLAYRFTKQITGSVEAAMVAVLLGCFHASLITVYYFTSLLYDLLASVFFLLAFTTYVSNREQEKRPTAWIVVLGVCAMNAKEIAATLPIFLIAYELLFKRTREWKVIVGLSAVTMLFAVGRFVGDGSLGSTPGYRPVIGVVEILRAHASYLESIFYQGEGAISATMVVGLWVVLAAAAWLTKSRPLTFWLLWIILAPMPTAIIGRGGGPGLYLPLTGWAAFAGWLLTRIPRTDIRKVVVAVALLTTVRQTAIARRASMPAVYEGQRKTWAVIERLRSTKASFRSGDTVLVVNDLFDSYDSIFILRLWSGIPNLDVTLEHKILSGPVRFTQTINLR